MSALRIIFIVLLFFIANISFAESSINIENIKSSKPFIYFSPGEFYSNKEMMIDALKIANKKNNNYTIFVQISSSVDDKMKAEICRTIMKSGFSGSQIKIFASDSDQVVKIFLN